MSYFNQKQHNTLMAPMRKAQVKGKRRLQSNKMPNVDNQKLHDAKDTYMAIKELSDLLDTKLDQGALTICIQLCEAGVNPEALATCIRELQKETAGMFERKDEDTANSNTNFLNMP